MKDQPHAVYIIHFATKHYHTQHYLGISYQPAKRLEYHMKGRGNKLVQAVVLQKIPITMVILMWFPNYSEAKTAEFNMKKYRNHKRWCTCCN